MIQITDNFLPKESFDKLKSALLSEDFPWHFYDRKVKDDDGDFQFVHVFHAFANSSHHIHILSDLLDTINPKALVRIKSNLTTLRPEIITNDKYHVDVDFECTTGIFYVNTTNGQTIFENGEKVDCIENRYVSFPSQLKHGAIQHDDNVRRVVINFNYFK